MTEVLINGIIKTSVMKELTKFTESEVKKENKFSRSRNFDFPCNVYVSIIKSVSNSWKSHFG